ncbi:hypothetical protein M3C31_00070 [Staphylococcus hominis]|nr:hypothetical protein [Staphylococcus hominis]MCT1482242.1 hypothetical protein [Staphylococcus hominis]
MAENENLKANPNYVIEELTANNAALNREIAIYKAIIREQSENKNSASGE